MLETPLATFFLDQPVNESTVPAGPRFLQGWVVAKPGIVITDLRLRVGPRLFPVFHGHPRADLARHFGAREPFLLAGFEAEIELTAGENRLEFDACLITGEWRPLITQVLYAIDNTFDPLPRAGTVNPHEFSRALRLTLQRARDLPLEQAAHEVAALLPYPFVTRFSAIPFHGHLHHPPLLLRADFGRMIVEGWIFHETKRIRQVAATVDLQAWQTLEMGGERPYVASLHPDQPHARFSGIHGFIDIPAQLPQPVSVRLYAELEEGNWTLCHVQRNHVYDHEQNKVPYVAGSLPTFWRAAKALEKACLARGFLVPRERKFYETLREDWRDYRIRRLPRRAPAPDEPRSATIGTAPGRAPARVTLVTHNLNYEGAPLFLVEYAGFLAAHGSALTIVSAAEGPLRARYEALGARVHLVDVKPLREATRAGDLRREIAALGRTIDLDDADLVVANTLSAYWGIHLAKHARRPSLFYIHESTTPDCFYLGQCPPSLLPVVKQSFALASHVSFLTESTRHYYRPLLTRANHSLNPGWIDLARLDHFRATHTRESLRARLHLAPATRLVINPGTVCERKGQHIFARAVDLLWRSHPHLAAHAEFLMIGARHTRFDREMDDLLGTLNRPNLRLVPETPAPYDYYGAADLYVCSSYEESFPRVVLEAMGFSLPILSSAVHGIPEMVRADREALLVPPGDSAALAAGMARLLSDPSAGTTLASRARSRVAADYDSVTLLPRHLALACAVSLGKL